MHVCTNVVGQKCRAEILQTFLIIVAMNILCWRSW